MTVMFHRILAAGAVLGALSTPLAAQAKPQGNEMTLTGTVIDLNCYVANGATGASHKACAEACAKAGVQLGVLSSDGTIYVPISSKAADPTNPQLIPHAESKVKITGTHRMTNGLHTIEVKTIAAAM
jgi:type 1 fimbria pilin